ncbi:MAG: type IX secretion system sortase PorU [Muribaculaceae bacterium]
MTNVYNIIRCVTVLACAMLFGTDVAQAFSADSYAAQSRLSSGRWVKVSVTQSGVYRITASDAKKWGFSDLSKLRVYGYGGAMISEYLTESNYIDDLPEVPTYRSDNAIVFYAQGPVTIKTGTQLTYEQVQHAYAVEACYFVTDEEDESPTATPEQSSVGMSTGGNIVNTFTDISYYEKDIYSVGETGRQLFGEDFRYNSTQTFKLEVPDYVADSELKVLTRFGVNCKGAQSRLLFRYNGTQLASSTNDQIEEVSSEYQHVRVANTVKSFSLGGSANDFSYSVSLSYSGALNTARLDYITVNYTRRLAMRDGALVFRYAHNGGDVALHIDGGNENTHVWDVTNVVSPVEMACESVDGGIGFTPSLTGDRTYVAFDATASLPAPQYKGTVKQQNIHGELTPDMIIITPSEYATQARRVATLHEVNDGMRVLVVEDAKVFNEFSSGTPDAMAYRKMCKMFYDRGADDEGHKLQYLLLMGDGSFDNRVLTDMVKVTQYPMLLTYQSEESTNEYTSFVTDDIFVMLDDYSGNNLSSAKLSIAVGRMPVKSVTEAKAMVDKLYKYVENRDYGAWKSIVTVLADDQNSAVHMKQAESIIGLYGSNGAEDYQFNRIYVDAYDNKSSGGSRVCQVGRDKLYRQFDEGMLWLSFIGHANTTSWTGEQILTWYDVTNFYNKRLPFLFAATCSFARFDAFETSGGEVMYLNEQSGVIAELSSTRLAYIPNNGTLNNAIARYAFAHNENGEHYTIGEFVRLGKNEVRDDNRLRYVLFGDPAMKLCYPDYVAKVETINGYSIDDDNMPTFQARQTLTFTGSIVDGNGEPATDFNGAVVSTLYDAEQSVETLGYGEDGEKYVYQDRSNRLAIASDSVQNGRFTLRITIPSELSAVGSFDNYSPARLCLYAYDNTLRKEALGSNDSFYIYGFDDTVETDTVGPEIRLLALNSSTFADGDNVNESPLVLADIYDKNGINFSSGGIGHDITLLVDDVNMYSDVSSFFTPTIESNGNAGTIAYQLSDLTPGLHKLRLKVWNVWNVSSEKTIEFNVVKGLKPELYDVYTTSNPAVTEAVFYVKHNRPEALLTITLQVFDLMGREVWSTTQRASSDMYTSSPITWDLTDAGGRRVPRGIYVYRASVSTDGTHYATKSRKLAVAAE